VVKQHAIALSIADPVAATEVPDWGDEPYIPDPPRPQTPTKRLLFATLCQALFDVSDRDPEIRRAARDYILAPECGCGAPGYTFAELCSHLGLSADALRAAVPRLRRRRTARRRMPTSD
jgi:hypothetical protein